MVAPSDVTDDERDLYPGAAAPNVIRALSLVPEAVRDLTTLLNVHYLSLGRMGGGLDTGRALDRAQIELIAGRVSALNECFY